MTHIPDGIPDDPMSVRTAYDPWLRRVRNVAVRVVEELIPEDVRRMFRKGSEDDRKLLGERSEDVRKMNWMAVQQNW